MTAVYPGSFDPITYGHLNIIERASKICDRLVIGVLENVNKTPMFTTEERIGMIRKVTEGLSNVEIKSFEGFSVDFAVENNAEVIVRGLRGETDFAYELQLSQINRALKPEVDTVFFSTDISYSIISSSGAKEIAMHGGDISKFVPPVVADRLIEKFKNQQEIKK